MTHPAARSLRAIALPVLAACLPLGVAIANVSPAWATTTDLATVVINEVESNNDSTHGDWIELYNYGEEDVDLTGAILSDNSNTHSYTIGSVTLAAGGFQAFTVDGAGGFGLGSADSARLFAAGTTDLSTTPANAYSWTAHASTTYGRDWANPDGNGLGQWATTAYSTFATANVFPTGNPADITSVRINEVESNEDATHGDWIELYNTSASAVTLDGAMLSDSEDAHVLVIPSGTTIAGYGYKAFRTDTGAGSFGLGSSDEARLFAAGDTGLTTVIDSLTWTNHATNTWGRTVPGAGTWAQTSASTYEAVNQFTSISVPDIAGVVINEVESAGDDTHGDWVELKNTTGSAIDLGQAIISDNNDGHVFRVPSGTSLAAGALAAFAVDAPSLGDGAFGLGDVDSARLFRADAIDLSVASPVDSRSWTTHAPLTYGRDGSGTWTTTHAATYGTANDFTSTITPDISWVVLNEIESSGGTPGDWIELYNTSNQAITLDGAQLSDSDNTHVYTIPANTTIAANGYYVVDIDSVTGGFGLGSDDAVRFYRAGKTVGTDYTLDHDEWTAHAANSYGRTSLGLGDWVNQSCGTSKGAVNCS